MSEEFWGFPNALTPAGSAWYYIARFSPPRRRDEIAAWLAWFAHIDRIAAQTRDPGVSRLKLDWWREEATLTQQGIARHPIARTLSTGVTGAWQVAQMQRALNAVEQRIMGWCPMDSEAFVHQCQTAWGSRMSLLANAENPAEQEWADCAGRYYSVVEQLQYLGRDLQRGYLPLPQDRLQRAGLNLGRLQDDVELPGLNQIARELLSDAENAWGAVRRQTCNLPSFDPVLRLTSQARRTARLLRRHGFQTHRKTPRLTPIGLLWSAWRGC